MVIATSPADGAVEVEPSTAITIVLSPESGALGPADVKVSDGGNLLPGTLIQIGTSPEWQWAPDYELPRRSTISVAIRSEVMSSFAVRDYAQEAVLELPGEEVGFSLSWPNGRRALITASGRFFEVTSTGLLERFVAVQPGARAYGDGDFICERTEAGVHYCVRGNLDGTIDRVPTPFNEEIGDNNQNGDVVVLVPTTVGTPSDWGLWRLMRSDLQFSIAGSAIPEFVTDVPSIQPDGTVSLAYMFANRLRLSLFRVGSLVGEHHELPDATVGHFDAGEDGRGVLAYGVSEPGAPGMTDRLVVRVARYEPGAGLTVLPTEAHSWPITLPNATVITFWGIDAVHVGELGSACIVMGHGYRSSFGLPGMGVQQTIFKQTEVVRVEPDDSLSPVVAVMDAFLAPRQSGFVHVTPQRAELWAMNNTYDFSRLVLARSRPSEDEGSIAYKVDPFGPPFGSWCFSVDDSGRAVLALTEGPDGQITTRILRLN